MRGSRCDDWLSSESWVGGSPMVKTTAFVKHACCLRQARRRGLSRMPCLSRRWLFGATPVETWQSRRWLAISARGGSVATYPGFGRERTLGAVRHEPSGSCRNLRPPPRMVSISSEVAPEEGRALRRGSDPRDRTSYRRCTGGSDLDAGSGPPPRAVQSRKARPTRGRTLGSVDWRLRSYSAVAPEDREGKGVRSSGRGPDEDDRKTSRPSTVDSGQRRRGRAQPIRLYGCPRSSEFG